MGHVAVLVIGDWGRFGSRGELAAVCNGELPGPKRAGCRTPVAAKQQLHDLARGGNREVLEVSSCRTPIRSHS